MPFEINTLQQTQPQAVGTPEGARVAAQRTDKPKSDLETNRSAGSETVSLTDTAAKLHKFANEVESLPVVDTERVDSIKRSLDNGTYEVKPERIAEKMMSFERNMA
ncbi:flagellar biosynthesis anti-sigma factor FlgM [Endothiovibrio diazotrophicus]